MAHIVFHDPRLASVAGGGEQVALLHAKWLAEAGHKVSLVTRARPTSALLQDSLSECPGLHLSTIDAPHQVLTQMNDEFVPPTLQQNLAESDCLALDSLSFNTVAASYYASNPSDVIVTSCVPDLCGLPSNRVHVLALTGLPPSSAIAALEAPLIGRANHVTAPSEYTADSFRSFFPTYSQARPVHVVYPGIAEAFRDTPAAREITFDVCFAGRVSERKGIQHLLRAVALIKPRLRIAIVGDGPELEPLRELARSLGIASQVKLLGMQRRAQVANTMDQSMIFCYPVFPGEAFGLAPLEAMARGVPVVCTNEGGMREYIVANYNALTCVVGDVDTLARHLTALTDSADLRKKLIVGGLETAGRFGADATRDRVLQLYQSFI